MESGFEKAVELEPSRRSLNSLRTRNLHFIRYPLSGYQASWHAIYVSMILSQSSDVKKEAGFDITLAHTFGLYMITGAKVKTDRFFALYQP